MISAIFFAKRKMMGDLTERIVSLDKKALEIIRKGEKEAKKIESEAEKKYETILDETKKRIARTRNEKFSLLREKLESLKNERMRTIEKKKERITRELRVSDIGKKMADIIQKRLCGEDFWKRR